MSQTQAAASTQHSKPKSSPPLKKRKASTAAPAYTKNKEQEKKAPQEAIKLGKTFKPTPAWQAYLADKRSADVKVKAGKLAEGMIKVKTSRKNKDKYVTAKKQYLDVSHPFLDPLQEVGLAPVLVVKIGKDNEVTGYLSVRHGKTILPEGKGVVDSIKKNTEKLGLNALNNINLPLPDNKLEDGVLKFKVENLSAQLGGLFQATGQLGLHDDKVVFEAESTIDVKGLSQGTLKVSRDEKGVLKGGVKIGVNIASISGEVEANLTSLGDVHIEGKVGYNSEKFSGSITLLSTAQSKADEAVKNQIGTDALMQEKKKQDSAKAADDKAKAPVKKPRKKEPQVLVGWGDVTARLTPWLEGKSNVIVDRVGHVTLKGEITPPAQIIIFKQRDFDMHLFAVEVRTLYGIPLVGNVFVSAKISMDSMASLGPATLKDIKILGTYSTDPKVLQSFSISGALNISAFAGLRLRAEGAAGIQLLMHDIKTGVGVNGIAGVRGYVEATPTLEYKEKQQDAKKVGESRLKGNLQMAAQPFLGLSGDLFVELDSPWWSPAPDEKWTWPIGSLEYPLPGEFGIGADIDYLIGSGEAPKIKFGKANFNKDKFMTDLVNREAPKKKLRAGKKKGAWNNGDKKAEGDGKPKVDAVGGAGKTGKLAENTPKTQAASGSLKKQYEQKKNGTFTEEQKKKLLIPVIEKSKHNFRTKKGEDHTLFIKLKNHKNKISKDSVSIWIASDNPTDLLSILKDVKLGTEKQREAIEDIVITLNNFMQGREYKDADNEAKGMRAKKREDNVDNESKIKESTLEKHLNDLREALEGIGFFEIWTNNKVLPPTKVTYTMENGKAKTVTASPLSKVPGNTKGEKADQAKEGDSPLGWDIASCINKGKSNLETIRDNILGSVKDEMKNNKEKYSKYIKKNKNKEEYFSSSEMVKDGELDSIIQILANDLADKKLIEDLRGKIKGAKETQGEMTSIKGWVRAHLLNHNLHGPAVKWNFFPLLDDLNKRMETGIESKAKKCIEDGGVLEYKTVVNYVDESGKGDEVLCGKEKKSTEKSYYPSDFSVTVKYVSEYQPDSENNSPCSEIQRSKEGIVYDETMPLKYPTMMLSEEKLKQYKDSLEESKINDFIARIKSGEFERQADMTTSLAQNNLGSHRIEMINLYHESKSQGINSGDMDMVELRGFCEEAKHKFIIDNYGVMTQKEIAVNKSISQQGVAKIADKILKKVFGREIDKGKKKAHFIIIRNKLNEKSS